MDGLDKKLFQLQFNTQIPQNLMFLAKNIHTLKDTKGRRRLERTMGKSVAWTYYGQKTSK